MRGAADHPPTYRNFTTMTLSKASAGWWTALVLVCGAGPAPAQIESQSNAPIDITADQAEVIQSKCEAIWRGAAEVLQEHSRIRADKITVFSHPKPAAATARAGSPADSQTSCGAADKYEADGHVYYVTPDRHVRGDHAVYTQADDQIVMTGDVIVVQGESVARGDKLIIDVGAHQARMVSDASGLGKPGRVRGVYFPDKAAPATPAAKP
jgi:lipopolysaccharide export system protein LptA